MFTFAGHALAVGHITGTFPGAGGARLTGGSPRYQLYPTRDGKLVACGALEQKFWLAFTAAIGLAPRVRRRPPRSGGDQVGGGGDHRRPHRRRMAAGAGARPIAASPSSRRWRRRCAIRISPAADCSTTRSRAHRAPPCRRCRCRSIRRSARGRRSGRCRRSAPTTSSLQRLAAHQPRLRSGRRDALAQDGAAQRADPVDKEEAEAARALHRQEIRQQRAVEQIDRERAALDVGAARGVVAREQVGRAGIAAAAARLDRQLADGRGVAQAEVEALRADRRNGMRRFADQRDAIERERAARSRSRAGKRRGPARRAILPRIECERRSISSASAASSSAAMRSRVVVIDDADQARASARAAAPA